MPKASYIPWTFSEEDNLPRWLSQHFHLSWEEKSEEYHKQFGRRRVPSHYEANRISCRKRFSTARHTAIRRARLRRQRHLLDIPDAPPTFSLKGPEPESLRLVQRFLMEKISPGRL
ncbi:uncharacterized protein N7477_009537 [Penicillium maclennaniae]|uniref:uncharacterized protein n=1 Tax=Penicillium maclennaniae TaxID=1343394 RepID=UPI0025407818|nr:uncharacterized protein N7477_009537 [Penicillium maclennaniae]KAJ5661921.1 hypothetical protein N7477_009537 [Penicillium maclennaniae]